MPVHNAGITRVLDEIADLHELEDENPFPVRACRNAARVVGELALHHAIHRMLSIAPPKLPDIADDLEAAMGTIAATRHLRPARRAGPRRLSRQYVHITRPPAEIGKLPAPTAGRER